jgi:hypothetical protein
MKVYVTSLTPEKKGKTKLVAVTHEKKNCVVLSVWRLNEKSTLLDNLLRSGREHLYVHACHIYTPGHKMVTKQMIS